MDIAEIIKRLREEADTCNETTQPDPDLWRAAADAIERLVSENKELASMADDAQDALEAASVEDDIAVERLRHECD